MMNVVNMHIIRVLLAALLNNTINYRQLGRSSVAIALRLLCLINTCVKVMKQVTIKAVTVHRDFAPEDYAFLNRIVTVLQTHNLSVSLSISKDRHKRKLPGIKMKSHVA